MQGVCGGDVEHELILELIEYYNYKSGDATEGDGVGPKAAVLELASSGPDIGLVRPGRSDGASG